MRRYNIVPLILLILSIIDFALAAPVLMPEKCQACVDVVHVPKDVVTVLAKRGDELAKLEKLFSNFDRWWGGSEDSRFPESSSAVLPPSSSAPLESDHGSTQVHEPPANPAPSTESDRDPESSVWHPPASSTASSSEPDSENEPLSLEPVSGNDREEMDMDHNPPPPDSDPEDAPPSSPGSDSDPALTVGNLGEASSAPATSATGGILRRGAGMSFFGISDHPKTRKQSASRGSANEVF